MFNFQTLLSSTKPYSRQNTRFSPSSTYTMSHFVQEDSDTLALSTQSATNPASRRGGVPLSMAVPPNSSIKTNAHSPPRTPGRFDRMKRSRNACEFLRDHAWICALYDEPLDGIMRRRCRRTSRHRKLAGWLKLISTWLRSEECDAWFQLVTLAIFIGCWAMGPISIIMLNAAGAPTCVKACAWAATFLLPLVLVGVVLIEGCEYDYVTSLEGAVRAFVSQIRRLNMWMGRKFGGESHYARDLSMQELEAGAREHGDDRNTDVV